MRKLLRFRLPATIFLLGIIVVATCARFINISKASIWHDEGYTMMLAPMGPIEIIERTARDVHPPLYYLVLHYWMMLFGSSEAAARSLSAVLMIAAVPLVYLLMKRLYTETTARLAALFVALAPFLVRYSQEARMYGMVAFLLLAATYVLLRALQEGGRTWWGLYSVLIAASLYTHYYSLFIIVAHWIYVTVLTSRVRKTGLASRSWWLSNILALVLFAPWIPAAYAQVTRVSGGFWIPPTNDLTLPHTLMQFMKFSNADELSGGLKIVLTVVMAGLIGALLWSAKRYRVSTTLITAATLAGPLLVILVSVVRPVYVDRYFVFSALFFCCLLAAIIVHGWPLRRHWFLQSTAIMLTVTLFGFGISNVYAQADHQMRTIGQVVSDQYEAGDVLVSGELYTYFDFSYYNRSDSELKLLAPGGINGYGETSLIYDRADDVVVNSLNDVRPESNHVWVIGKTGQHDYFDNVPESWKPNGPKYEYGYSAAQRYTVTVTPLRGAVQ